MAAASSLVAQSPLEVLAVSAVEAEGGRLLHRVQNVVVLGVERDQAEKVQVKVVKLSVLH